MGGFAGGGPRGSFQHGFNHQFVSHHNFGGHRFVFHDQFFRDHRRFFVGFDFMIGFGSREAIRTFQAAQGLSATGLIDPALLKALKLEHGERQSIRPAYHGVPAKLPHFHLDTWPAPGNGRCRRGAEARDSDAGVTDAGATGVDNRSTLVAVANADH